MKYIFLPVMWPTKFLKNYKIICGSLHIKVEDPWFNANLVHTFNENLF